MKKTTIIITAFYCLIAILFIWGFFKPNTFHLEQNNTITSIRQGNSTSPISIRAGLVPPDAPNQKIILDIREITFFDLSIPKDSQTICVHSLMIIVSGYGRTWIGDDPHTFLDKDKICSQIISEPSTGNTFQYSSNLFSNNAGAETLSEELNYYNNPFYYPYDNFKLQSAAFVTLDYMDKNGELIEKRMIEPFFQLDTEGGLNWDRAETKSTLKDFWIAWNIDSLAVKTKDGTKNTKNVYLPLIEKEVNQPHFVTFKRPLIVRIIFPIIILSFLAFIYLLTVVDSLELFFSGAIAVLAGLFGIQGVLNPTNIQARTLVDFSIVVLYVIFATSTIVQVIRFVPIFFKTKDEEKIITDVMEKPQNNKAKPSRRDTKTSSKQEPKNAAK